VAGETNQRLTHCRDPFGRATGQLRWVMVPVRGPQRPLFEPGGQWRLEPTPRGSPPCPGEVGLDGEFVWADVDFAMTLWPLQCFSDGL
jgi:hypothetical protein